MLARNYARWALWSFLKLSMNCGVKWPELSESIRLFTRGLPRIFIALVPRVPLDRSPVGTLRGALLCSQRSYNVTPGTSLLDSKPKTTPDKYSEPLRNIGNPRQSEDTAVASAKRGLHACVARPPPPSVHGPRRLRVRAEFRQFCREEGFCGHIGHGANCWAAFHRRDAALMNLRPEVRLRIKR